MPDTIEKGKEKKSSWFERNPKKTLMFSVLVFWGLIDWIVGAILIPQDYNVFRTPHPFYHHDLIPNQAATAKWGDIEYPMFTNLLGFRDRVVRAISRKTSKKRILFIGDSFTEALGVSYEDSFVGVLDKKLKDSEVEVLNAAVVSYSPKLYYLKIQYLLEKQGLHFDHVFVFIDISDVQNELSYEQFEPLPFPIIAKFQFDLKRYLKSTSFFYYALTKFFQKDKDSYLTELRADGLFPCFADMDDELLDNKDFRQSEVLWTLDSTIYEQFGKKGLALARDNMQKLVELCEKRDISVTIAVYPWQAQILYRDLDSIQVKFWQKFCEDNNITFINLFPEFINEVEPEVVYNTYFIPGDVHWNAAGHLLVANKVLEYIQ